MEAARKDTETARANPPWRYGSIKYTLWTLLRRNGSVTHFEFEAAVGKQFTFDRTRMSEMRREVRPLGYTIETVYVQNTNNAARHAVYKLVPIAPEPEGEPEQMGLLTPEEVGEIERTFEAVKEARLKELQRDEPGQDE